MIKDRSESRRWPINHNRDAWPAKGARNCLASLTVALDRKHTRFTPSASRGGLPEADVMSWTPNLKGAALALTVSVALAGCGVNTIPTKEETAKAAWAEVQTQYQRRADLVPNLVATVKGYAAQEK